MTIELDGQQYALRASMLAIQEAQQKEQLEIAEVTSPVDVSKLLYYFAKHGAREAGEKFTVSMSGWLDSIQLDQIGYLTEVLNGLIGVETTEGEGKKKER